MKHNIWYMVYLKYISVWAILLRPTNWNEEQLEGSSRFQLLSL